MEMIPRSVRAVRFGPFEVDLRAGELRKQDRRIRLPDQPLHILTVLLEHPGEMVTREELRQRLWPADTFVDFDHGLNNAINRLREALGDSVEKPTYIETISRRGGGHRSSGRAGIPEAGAGGIGCSYRPRLTHVKGGHSGAGYSLVAAS